MSENFSKNIKKKTFRAKEKLLESLGKADKTIDEAFEENANNFNRQQKHFEHLQRELLNYVNCLKAVTEAHRGYYDAVREAYDSDWMGADHVRAISHSLELLWDDYIEKLTEESLNPLNDYCSHFVDLKAKISKRGRKLIDYDGARHAYESIKSSTKKMEESKLLKAEQDLNAAKQLYGALNSELSIELPVLYDGRYSFLVNHMQTMFTTSANFHSDSNKLLEDIQHAVTPKIRVGESRQIAVNHDANWEKKEEEEEVNRRRRERESGGEEQKAKNNIESIVSSSSAESNVAKGSTEKNPFASDTDESPKEPSQPSVGSSTPAQNGVLKSADKPSEAEESGKNALYPDLSNFQVLYKVRATHRYTAEDTDELSFEAGEVIIVVPYENPEEEDEGWLMGVIEATGKKGVFPGNFTKPI